jgi:hypothetical protein
MSAPWFECKADKAPEFQLRTIVLFQNDPKLSFFWMQVTLALNEFMHKYLSEILQVAITFNYIL